MGRITNHLVVTLLVLAFVHSHSVRTPTCPVTSASSNVHHGHINIAVGGMVNLINGVDSLCYDYPLSSAFQQEPGVALAVSRFEANPAQELFFSIMTSKSQSLSSLSFLIRTQWKYTQWSSISVNFFAEAHPNYDAHSFMIDTTALAGCAPAK